MGKTSGSILILAGLAVGACALYPELQASAQIAARLLQQAGGGGDSIVHTGSAVKVAGDATPVVDKPTRLDAAPGQPEEAPKAAPDASSSESGSRKAGPRQPDAAPPTQVAPPVPVPAPVPIKRPRSAVAVVELDEAPPRVPVGEAKTAEPKLVGAALTREIQAELKRVGCYRGDVTGIWSPPVREAMRDFTRAANASLPVHQPDPVLLAMLKSHAPGVCGRTCPQGEARAANGRCVSSVLAAAKGGVKSKGDNRAKGGFAGSTQTAKATADAGAKRPDGKSAVGSGAPDASVKAPDRSMALADPPIAGAPKAKRPVRRQARVAGWSRSVQGTPRVRRAHRPPSYKGYSGLPSWVAPLFGGF